MLDLIYLGFVPSRIRNTLLSIINNPSYTGTYPNITASKEKIFRIIEKESEEFGKILQSRKLEKILEQESKRVGDNRILKADIAFQLVTALGYPIDHVKYAALTHHLSVDLQGFESLIQHHREISRAGAEKKFKGGLADTSEASVKYHTTTHLLHQALREVLGSEVRQKGSNITPERLRFDFAFSRKMTEEEKKKVEEIVNEKIRADLPVHKITLPLAEAKKSSALHFFDEKYPDEVLVHYIGDSLETAYSKEFCGGPHVAHTGLLGSFRIAKEEAVSQDVRRIKAVLM